MKRLIACLMCAGLVLGFALAEQPETHIVLSDDLITVNGQAIAQDTSCAVFVEHKVEEHEDVPDALKNLENRVVTIAQGGVYRISGSAQDAQIAVRAPEDQSVRIILDNADISCRTAPAIAVYSALEPNAAGEYGVVLELADGSVNAVNGAHAKTIGDEEVNLSGAISSLVSIGFEGTGSLNVEADEEGIEVKFGHMTFNGGQFHILANDDPINVSEDEVGVLTINDGYIYSSVNPRQGGEGDGMDSNGAIIINGGVAIGLAHPESGDSGLDSDLGSAIHGGVVIGAGNMYDPIDSNSEQLYMVLEFAEQTDDLLVVTNSDGEAVFAYDFPHSYKYITFSTPDLREGTYHVYLGGEIVGEEKDGLYTDISAYTPGTQLQHGGMQIKGMDGNVPPQHPFDAEMNEQVPAKPDWQNGEGFNPPGGRKMEDMPGDNPDGPDDFPVGGKPAQGVQGPGSIQNHATAKTCDFVLTRAITGFTNVAAQ